MDVQEFAAENLCGCIHIGAHFDNPMKTNRRCFLAAASLGVGALHVSGLPSLSAAPSATSSSPARKGRMQLGLVTYNLAKDWDVPTLIRHCEETGFEGVELRTTHAHGVEVNLTPAQRAEVKQRFAASKVQLMGLGSAFDYHTPDTTKLRADIEATKQYVLLAHDVGATGVKVRPNGLPKEVPAEKTLEQIGRSLGELGKFAKNYGQQIRLEVHGTGTSLLPNVQRIIEVADHESVGVCWNSNQTDLEGQGFEHNFELVKDKIFSVHLRDLFLQEYPFRKLFSRLQKIGFAGFAMAEIPESKDPVRVMHYFRALWLAYQDLL
jgi:sugar phosphate isomerase/epimerase